ncbi:hypothetical protein Plec18167_001757 [Paecilomyces lecythidis]|uniref:BZIP domain-containing protein n=1 Tax=Paecilomyces lecythidis TaxID=3004212 RepID=A0ABR3Y9V7_9EURO
MVSMLEANDSSNNDSLMESVVPKSEPPRDPSVSSAVSTPEAEVEALAQDVVQTQKRKGGRKPIYATSEERKQRNRQAQAAFRERRTEYIKQLETTIKHNEETLQSLQQSHRSAADECLMLRYKNSLLERILLEKGIDVQAELRLKGAAPGMPPVKPSGMAPKQPAPLERTAIHRNSLSRQKAGIVPKPDQPGMPQQHREGAYGMQSPQLQPTPSSHVSSPSTARSPGFGLSGAMSPTSTEFQTQQQQQHGRPPLLPQQRSFNQGPSSMGMANADSMEPATSQSVMPGGTAPIASRMSSAYYPSPFQKHYDQLGKLSQQEYDAQADLLDDTDHADTVNTGSFVPDFGQPPAPNGSQRLGMQSQSAFNPQTGEVDQNAYGGSNNPLFGQFEPMLDTDPFGLNASMHFQTPYSYEQNQHLRQ